MATKTQEELDALKAGWLKDPCWDIEDSEGFEEHKEELLAYRLEVEADAERKSAEEKAERAKQMKEETGITDPIMAQCLYTFGEIASLLNRDGVVDIAHAQATLMLAAQVKRVADYLDRMLDEHDAEVERQEIVNLYKQ